MMSPPSRGAWFEIVCITPPFYFVSRRPPRGGRGLKCLICRGRTPVGGVAPLAGGVD